MTLAETLSHKLNQLPLSRQLEVLDFVEFLGQRNAVPGPRHDPEGMLADGAPDLSIEDMDQARREAWKRFPREIPE